MAVHEKRKSSILLKGSNRPAYSLIDLTLLILYFFAACAFPAKAAHVGTSKLSNLEFRALTTDNGLSDQLVNTIFKDSEGYLWLGTGVGVDRFDGNNMVNYNFADADGTPRRITAIAEGRDGRIFVGSYRGLFEAIDGGKLIPLLPDKINFRVYALVYDRSSKLYIGSAQGLYIYDTISGKLEQKLIHRDVLFSDNEVTALAFASGDALWMTTQHSLHRLNLTDGRLSTIPMETDGPVRNIIDLGDKLYLGSYGSGVLVYDIAESTFSHVPRVGNDLVTSLSIDPGRPQTIYVSTDGEGVFRIDSGEVEPVFSSTSLRSKSIYSMLVDERGLFWLGYYQSGADYTPFYDDIFEVYSYPGHLDTRSMAVRAVSVDGPRKLIGTRDGLFYIDEEKGRSAFCRTPRLRSNIIFCIKPVDGKYYIGTYNGGMYVFDPADLSLSDFEGAPHDPFVSGTVFVVAQDPSGEVWAGTSDGVFRFSGGKLVAHYTSENSQLPSGNVYEIFFDSAGRGWMCAENGMAVWTGRRMQSDRFPEGFVNNMNIREVAEVSDGHLLFAPDRGRVFRSNMELTEYGFVEPESAESASSTTFIIEDRDNNKWFGSEKGLALMTTSGRKHLFTNADGLPDMVFTLCEPEVDSDGNLWFGNNSGLVKLDRRRFLRSLEELERKPMITDVLVNGKSAASRLHRTKEVAELRLNDGETGLTVNWSDLAYTHPRYTHIEYRLDGFDDHWHTSSGGSPVTYFSVPTGQTTLRMRMPGDPATETQLRIVRGVRINWTVWALSAMTILCVALVAWYMHRHQQHRRMLESLKAEAASLAQSAVEAEEEKKRNRYRTTRLSAEECRRILKVLDAVMRKEKPYTNTDLKSSDLATLAGCSSHDLSYVFNQHLEKSFYDYVNEYRVEEFKRLVAGIDTSRYTLSAMAEQCGFSSRASFFRHFKAITGRTPAEYMRDLKG